MIPVTGKAYWYFTAYFALAIFEPFLNTVLFSLNNNQRKMGFVLLFVMFSLQGFLNDPYQSAGGYSAIWLIILYCMGVLVKAAGIFENYKSKFLILLFLGSSLFATMFYIFTERRTFICYTSPTILLNGIVLVILFSRITVGKIGKFISKYSRFAFGIYLFHLNPIIWNCLIKDAFISVANSEIYIGILQVLGYAFIIFVCGLIVEIIRDRLFSALKVNKMAEKVNDLLGAILSKSTVLLGCNDDCN